MRAALLAHENRTAAGLFALFVLLYLWPALVQGHVLAPTALFGAQDPWRAISPADIGRYINVDLGDVPSTYYPWDFLARRLIHAGTFPAWSPFALAGTPLFANPEIAWASPFSLPLWIFPLNYGLGVAAALKLWIAAFGTYLLVRELRLGFWPGIVAGASFGLCAFNVVWLSYGVFVTVAALLPWGLWLTERIVTRGRDGDALALAVVVALILTGGHPGTQVHVLAAIGLYALVRLASEGVLSRQIRARRLALAGGALALGTLAAAVVLLPALLAAHDTVGSARRAGGAVDFNSARLPFGALRTALFPDWWGRPSEAIVHDAVGHVTNGAVYGPPTYRERTFYAGSVALVLAAIALVLPGGWRRKAPFALLGMLGVAIALRAPGLYPLVLQLPGFGQIQNGRIYLWFTLAVPLLAAFGVQALLDAPKPSVRVWAMLGAALLAAPIAVASIQLGGGTLAAALRHVVRRTVATPPPALALASVLWWLAFVVVLGLLVLIAARRPRQRQLLGGLLALVVALDMLHFAHGYQPIGPASVVIPRPTPAIGFLQRHAGDQRIAGTVMQADWAQVYGLRDARGAEAPQPTLRFARLWHLMDPSAMGFLTAPLTPQTSKVLGLLGTRYFITGPDVDTAPEGMREVHRGRDARVFVNPLAVPRAFVAAQVRVASDEDEEIGIVGADDFDPRSAAVVRADELTGAGARTLSRGAGAVRVVTERNADVTLRATVPRPSLVVLDDQWAPGWTVQVDGRPARALRTDVVLRGVVVPAGTHEIRWRYRPPGLRAGVALSAVGVLVALVWGGMLTTRARRRRH